MLCTPSCSICFKNYYKDCNPVVIQPCGHGGCSVCIEKIRIREDAKCPICRGPIENASPNYELREITNSVDRQDTYWGRRIMEIVDLPGQNIEISSNIEPFCEILFYRLTLDTLFQELKDTITEEQQEEIDKFKRIWTKTMLKSNISIEDAMSWLKIFDMPHCLHTNMINYVLEFYEKKYFLEKYDALWIMSAIRI